MKQIRVGISGWNYKPWRRVFYPKGLASHRELEFASRQINVLEVNGTFYSLKKPADYEKWRDSVPDSFLFTVKGPRFITHIKRLREIEKPLANFFANGILELGPKLGPVLWQFPPQFSFDQERFEHFFRQLPHSFADAVRLGRKHDDTVRGRTSLPTKDRTLEIRHAIEVRHESFRDPKFFALLKKYDLALVDSDGAGQWPRIEKIITDFVYVRLHGGSKLYESGYDDPEILKLAKKIGTWKKGRDVFLFFDNDVKVRAPFDAMKLLSIATKFKPEYYRDHPTDRTQIKGESKRAQRKKKISSRSPS